MLYKIIDYYMLLVIFEFTVSFICVWDVVKLNTRRRNRILMNMWFQSMMIVPYFTLVIKLTWSCIRLALFPITSLIIPIKLYAQLAYLTVVEILICVLMYGLVRGYHHAIRRVYHQYYHAARLLEKEINTPCTD